MKSKPIFDAHLHILLKSLLTGFQMDLKKKSTDPWSNIRLGVLAGLFLRKTLMSQSNLNQIKEANARLVVHALFSPDYSLIDAGLVDKLGVTIVRVLRKQALQKLKDNSPKDNLLFELECFEYVKSNVPSNQLEINYLTKMSPYDTDKINLVFNIEGAHNFYSQSADGNHYFDRLFLNNLKSDSSYRICFVNLTHVQQWWACTHAYAMKLLDNCLSNPNIRYMFKPSGYGIQEEGFEIMEHLLNGSTNQRMLVDIKHMSLFSRLQFYAWRRKRFSDVPIVASHVGLTGRSWNFIKQGLYDVEKKSKFECRRLFHNMDKYKGHIDDTNFYPNSINLYDEEILEIVKSGGLIGISLDKRILGSQSEQDLDDVDYNDEYISNEEYKLLFDDRSSILERVGDDNYILDRDKINTDYGISLGKDRSIRENVAEYINTQYVPGVKSVSPRGAELIEEEEEKIVLNRQIEHFINTVLHIVMVGGVKAWDCMCIGSDFDGLITPIRKIKTIADLPKLRASTGTFIKENPNLWTGFSVTSFEDIEEKVQKLFFENGKRFIEQML